MMSFILSFLTFLPRAVAFLRVITLNYFNLIENKLSFEILIAKVFLLLSVHLRKFQKVYVRDRERRCFFGSESTNYVTRIYFNLAVTLFYELASHFKSSKLILRQFTSSNSIHLLLFLTVTYCMSQKAERPVLQGQRIKTRKRGECTCISN